MKFIGITGGVGAGKSTVLSFLKENYNCKILLADLVAKDVMKPDGVCFDSLYELLSCYGIFDESGFIRTDKMAKVLFEDDIIRQKVNAIVHPAVKQTVLNEVKKAKADGELDYFFFEAALLLEEDYDAYCDEVWYIFATEEERRKRLKADRGYSDEKIDGIFASQLKEETFRSRCHHVIDSSGSVEQTREQVKLLLQKECTK